LTQQSKFSKFVDPCRQTLGYEMDSEGDLIAASVVIAIDLLVNTLLICGANKDYSGRRKDLRYELTYLKRETSDASHHVPR
jgi:hypothetical protein